MKRRLAWIVQNFAIICAAPFLGIGWLSVCVAWYLACDHKEFPSPRAWLTSVFTNMADEEEEP